MERCKTCGVWDLDSVAACHKRWHRCKSEKVYYASDLRWTDNTFGCVHHEPRPARPTCGGCELWHGDIVLVYEEEARRCGRPDDGMPGWHMTPGDSPACQHHTAKGEKPPTCKHRLRVTEECSDWCELSNKWVNDFRCAQEWTIGSGCPLKPKAEPTEWEEAEVERCSSCFKQPRCTVCDGFVPYRP